MCAVYRTEAHRTEHSAGCQHRRNTDSAGGFGHGWCISKGDVLIQHPSQCLPCYARSTSSSFPPCSMPQTHRPFGSKQGSPHRSPGWTEGAGPSRKGYPIQGPPDGEEQTSRARGCAWAVGLGQALPTESPVPRAGEGPLSTMCVGWAGHGDSPVTTCPQTHSLHSESCAEGQLNSSLAVISRHLTPLHSSRGASPWQERASGKSVFVACFVGSGMSELPLAALELHQRQHLWAGSSSASHHSDGNPCWFQQVVGQTLPE